MCVMAQVGSKYGVSSKPIHLKVHSANVLTMTLIDLPGITRLAVGDQADNIPEVLTRMTMDFISKECKQGSPDAGRFSNSLHV